MNPLDLHSQLTPRELLDHYREGTNITRLLRERSGLDHNPPEAIEMAYDLQAGSYIDAMSDPQMSAHKSSYSEEIARNILSLKRPKSVLEAGVGEATTLSGVLEHLGEVQAYGFDLSWSRIACARRWLSDQDAGPVTLCTGDLLAIPFADNSVDVVYTSHSIEPNGGKEAPILSELYRVARGYLILLEPAYELAGDEARKRMESHGYCRNLPHEVTRLGGEIIHHGLFPFSANPLNPTAITVVRKHGNNTASEHVLACPQFRTPLLDMGDMLFSPEALAVYPVIAGIPCLRQDNAVLASKFPEIVGID